jgi:hypothetical protein
MKEKSYPIREARKQLCKLIQEGKPFLIHKGRGWNPAPIAAVLTIPTGSGKTEAARERNRNEQMHAQLTKLMKEVR